MPNEIIAEWESFPSYLEWRGRHGCDQWPRYEQKIQRAYRACRRAVADEPGNPRIRFILARLIDNGGGDEETLLSGEILTHCQFVVGLQPGHHHAHALLASHASFLSIAKAESSAETTRYSRLALVHAHRARELQPHQQQYAELMRDVSHTAHQLLGD